MITCQHAKACLPAIHQYSWGYGGIQTEAGEKNLRVNLRGHFETVEAG